MQGEGQESEYFANIGKDLEKAQEESPEKFSFEKGEKVLVTDPETGKQTAETFLGFDPHSGKAIVTVEGGKGTKTVEKINIQKVEKAS